MEETTKDKIMDLIYSIGFYAAIGGSCLYGAHKLDESEKKGYEAAIEARQMPEGCKALEEQYIQPRKQGMHFEQNEPLIALKCKDADGRNVFYYENGYPGRWKKSYGIQD
ncbi:MAG TPA: hypothetical protein HA362_06830 [Nanoarchaeota archaeon]|nr:hypothetical protein [Nanoarchaeota archaeon]